MPLSKPCDHSCSTCPVGGKNQTVSDKAWLRQRFSERIVSQFRDLWRLSACQSDLVCLWADSQEDRPLVGSHLLAFTNSESYGSGAWWALSLEINAEGTPQREKEQLELLASISVKSQALHRERLEGFWSFSLMLYFPHICYFISCVCMKLIGKPNMEGTSGPELGKWGQGREKDWVSSTADFKRNRKWGMEWVIAALRREEGKLGL